MKTLSLPAAAVLLAGLAVSAFAARDTVSSPKIRAIRETSSSDSALQPDTDVIDAPTTGVLDYRGYASRSRFYSQGGMLEYLSFGVYPGVDLGVSAAGDGIIGDETNVRMRAPTAQVKYRFFEGDQELPSLAMGFDGQGYRYNTVAKRFNQRQRGFYMVATRELGVPGFQFHPSFNISDFDTNAVFGCLPLTLNIRDKAELLVEWDNINNITDSRFNAGIRAFLTPNFHVDFAVRAIGAAGHYSDGAPRGPERIVQLKYSNSF